MRILVVNQHSMNFGDDAAGDALLKMLMASDRVTAVDVVYNGSDVDPGWSDRVSVPKGVRLREIGLARLLAYILLPRTALRLFGSGPIGRLVRVIREADVVLVAPSGANIGIYRDWVYLLRLLVVVRTGASPVFYLNTIGSSRNYIFDRMARYVLRRSTLYVRELRSQRYLKCIGLMAIFGPDTAFALDRLDEKVRDGVISVVPSELSSWHPDFQDSHIEATIVDDVAGEIARFAVANHVSVEILPHLRTQSERDFNVAFRDSMIAGGLAAECVAIVEVDNYREYDRQIATSRLVVGGRYHAVVLAAKNRRPFVSLGYEGKMAEVCRYVGLPELNVDLLANRVGLGATLGSVLNGALIAEDEVVSRLEDVVPSLARQVRRPLEDLGILAPEESSLGEFGCDG